MKVIKSTTEIDSTVELNITIGNFDGVHLGHQDFLKSIINEAEEINRKVLVITFVPHPAFVLRAEPHFLINTYSERRELLKKLGVDYLLELNFTRDFSTLKPEEFLRQFVFVNKKIKKIFLGHDFHFGANKTGNFELAKVESSKNGVELLMYSEYKVDSSSVSSTIVRNQIQEGRVEVAANMLGRNFFISGRVIKGQGRGRQIGFPTANLGYDKDIILPAKGVYVTNTILNGMLYESITNVGVNPTFNTGYDIHVETHLLDFSRDIYGDEIRVIFVKKIRDEKKFSSVNELVKQIEEDSIIARKYFKK